MSLRRINDEVFVAEEPIVRLGERDVAFLKRQAQANARKRARICAHKADDDALHEMMIVISAASYIHPHKHVGKSESFHVIEGEVDIPILDEAGEVVDVVQLGGAATGRNFYYRVPEHVFHTLLIRTDFLVVHEVTNGPFDRARTVLAPFAPPESEADEARSYMRSMRDAVDRYLGRATP